MRKLTEEEKSNKPPLNRPRINAEILAGGVVGFVGGIIPLLLFGGAAMVGGSPFHGFFALCLTMALVGSTLGSSISVYVIGNTDNEIGSFLATWVGSIVGVIGAVAILAILWVLKPLFPSASYLFRFFFWPSFFLLGIGATIGFNLTCRYKSGYENEPH